MPTPDGITITDPTTPEGVCSMLVRVPAGQAHALLSQLERGPVHVSAELDGTAALTIAAELLHSAGWEEWAETIRAAAPGGAPAPDDEPDGPITLGGADGAPEAR